jgi:hypothetical protein
MTQSTADPHAHYLISHHIMQNFAYTSDAKLIGERVYNDPASYSYEKLAPADVVTPEIARAPGPIPGPRDPGRAVPRRCRLDWSLPGGQDHVVLGLTGGGVSADRLYGSDRFILQKPPRISLLIAIIVRRITCRMHRRP